MKQAYQLPDLGPTYRSALDQALNVLDGLTLPLAVAICGSIVRGNPDAESDLDVFVLHDLPWRQRVQRRFGGVPVELFINHPSFIPAYFEEERDRGRPSTAHMLATGHLAFDTDGLMAGFINESRELLERGPERSEQRLIWLRYEAVTLLEDARDVAGQDSETCLLLAHRAVDVAVAYRFWDANRWQPRNKETLRELEALDPDSATLVRAVYAAGSLTQRLAAAEAFVLHVTGVRASFDWVTKRDPVRPDAPGV